MGKKHIMLSFIAVLLLSSCGFIREDLDAFVEKNDYAATVDVEIGEVTANTVYFTLKPSANTRRYGYAVYSGSNRVQYDYYYGKESKSIRVTGLKPNSSYVVNVDAENVLGNQVSSEYKFTTENDVEVKASHVDQFMGYWNLVGTDIDGNTVNSDNVRIYGYSSDKFDIIIEGLMTGKAYYYALGAFNESRGVIDLWGGWGLLDGRTFYLSNSSVLYYARFYPVYVYGSSFSYIYPKSDNVESIMSLSLNRDGSISFIGDSSGDRNGNYANGFCFRYFDAGTDSVKDNSVPIYNVRLTKIEAF